ncbi:MAG TPA: TonB family protein [Thermoanaerobaculia bacterium]|nr:TonB family protein [Thermoanaerobaculia bacterium]
MIAHRLLHDTLLLSTSYLAAVIAIGAACAAVGLLCTRLRRFSAASRHFVLSVALLAPAAAALLVATNGGAGLRAWLKPAGGGPGVDVLGIAAGPAAGELAANRSSEALCIVAVVWAAGFIGFIALSGRQWLRWSGVARRATSACDSALLAQFADAARGLMRLPRLALSDTAAEPMVVGLFRPVVLLPRHYAGSLDRRELDTVFAHELEHIRRRDNLTAAIHEGVCALFWFEPLHWMARRRLLDLRERACDERVLDLGCAAAAYLAALAKSSHASMESPAIACMSGFHIRERMESIMSHASNRARFAPERSVRATALLAALAVAAAFVLVSPAPSLAAAAAAEEVIRSFDVQLRPGVNGRVLVEVTITGADGQNVMSAKSTVEAGQPVRLSTTHGSRTYEVDVSATAAGGGLAVLEVIEGRKVVYRTSRTLPAQPEPRSVASKAPPITLQLKDADVHDVIRTFSQLTGQRITADPSVQGKVTIHAIDTPWDMALMRSLHPIGLTLQRAGDELRVVPLPERQSRPIEDGYVRVGEGIKPPELLARVAPIYTPEAKAARVSGIVIIRAMIDETGVVRGVEVLKPLPFGLSEAAALAVRQWVFAPALIDGKPVSVVYNVTINFRLEESDASAPPE